MTWLLKLYPPRWRHRYGEEFLALIAPQRFSFVTVMDIIGGAIDAWTRPQSHLAARAAAQSEGDTIMRYTTLKGWPGRTQAIFIGVLSMLVLLLTLGGAVVNSR